MRYVIAEVAALRLALPITALREVMRPLPMCQLGDAIGVDVGAAVVRGEVTAVLDAGAVLQRGTGRRDRWLSVRVGARTVILAVDRVHGVQRLDLAALERVSPLLDEVTAAALRTLIRVDGGLLAVLDSARLLDPVDAAALDAALESIPVATRDSMSGAS